MADAEQDDLEAQLPAIVGRVRASLRNGQFVFTFPDDQELIYTPEQCDPIYTTLYQHRRFLAGASFSIIPTPNGDMAFRLSGEGAVLLLAELRELRKQLGIPEPAESDFLRE
jgi:hypothetical protein